MFIRANMLDAGGGNYDYERITISPSGTGTINIHDGMFAIAPYAYESSQFEGCWYIKNGELTKVYQNPTPKATITYANDVLTIKNNTTGYSLYVWVYKDQS